MMRFLMSTLLVMQGFEVSAVPLRLQEKTTVTDWIALGSGCRGSAQGEGDLKMQVIQDLKDPLRLEVSFDMGSYKLSGDKPILKNDQNFARECSLRFAVNPKVNTRIKNVEARTRFLIEKDKGSLAEIHSRLVSAKGTLVDWSETYESSKSLKKEVAMNIVPNEEGRKILTQAECGVPRLLGADFTFENRRNSFKEKVEIKHAQENQVHFIIDLEPCI